MSEETEGATDAEETGRRLNRELIELLNELRVALPGVQVLFAFLLVVPFSERFHELGPEERAAFFVAFLASAVASACLIAPTAYHRLRWRHHDKERMLETCNRLAIAGTVFLAVAMTAVACLITSFLYGPGPAVALGVGVAGLLGGLWFALPLSRRRAGDRD
jgi:predicted membrane channel-forming protein YqfA (hemolysin III family)